MERARILEIGCGDGAHFLSVAAFEPGWTAHGLDGRRGPRRHGGGGDVRA
jgi:tRNA G46 methylase TrmB